MGLLENKLVLITGASKGIGKEIATLFSAEGANLVLLARNENNLLELRTSLKNKYNNQIDIFKCDIRSAEEIKQVFGQLTVEKKFIDVLVNNAGVMIDSTLQVVKDESIVNTFETNVYGTMLCCKHAIKHFLKVKKGSIINLSSIIGVNGSVGQSVYAASKAAVIGFTRSLSKELASFNFRVNAIAPGFIETDLTKGLESKVYEKNLAGIGMKRFGKPEDVAKVALFLASDLSEYVTGQVIGVDGGMVI